MIDVNLKMFIVDSYGAKLVILIKPVLGDQSFLDEYQAGVVHSTIVNYTQDLELHIMVPSVAQVDLA